MASYFMIFCLIFSFVLTDVLFILYEKTTTALAANAHKREQKLFNMRSTKYLLFMVKIHSLFFILQCAKRDDISSTLILLVFRVLFFFMLLFCFCNLFRFNDFLELVNCLFALVVWFVFVLWFLFWKNCRRG